ncbi:metallophosphoesterase [Halomonas sp. TRM85114]|uniref:metallophosphoesterase n=1 Tax=Halomonas jincaotanensis TaxID=2810616 RepID=UPI001BD4E3BC|nr:metallophosphoesterase [Halomonas jincaotanensis]MBS9404298.1 metallophosphoesterase [Halomonas jincaotanensis]
MRLVQITDLHLNAVPAAHPQDLCPLHRLEGVIDAVNRERPDQVLVTGDISDDETADSYRLAVEALSRLDAPWAWLAGNHDQPTLMANHRELPGELSLGNWRVLMPATRVEGQPHGALGAGGLAWLDARLAEDERPTVIAMHHPPVHVGSAWLDAIGLRDREAFWHVVEPHHEVCAVFFGHVHQAVAGHKRLAGGDVAVYGCPSTHRQFLAEAATFAIDEALAPGYRVIALHDKTLDTRVERVDT